MEVEKYGEELVEDPEKLLPFLLVTINDLFSKLEASIGHLHATRQVTSKSMSCSFFDYCCMSILSFELFPLRLSYRFTQSASIVYSSKYISDSFVFLFDGYAGRLFH